MLLHLVVALALASERTFVFTYDVVVPSPPAGAVHLWVPLPVEDDAQAVEDLAIVATIPGGLETEGIHGNVYWHGQNLLADGAPEIRVSIRAVVRRRSADVEAPGELGATERDRYLSPNSRVPVGADEALLAPILGEIRAGSAADVASPRAIYDWVVDNVTYKKTGTGWGNGDVFWACSERTGNCTDFHALFISLARTEGIPARFEMGFPIPEHPRQGTVDGYHCWVRFWLDGQGWVPIDASEAAKDPSRRDELYGAVPTDRIHLSTGRDLRLGPDHKGPALNYFIDPYVEVSGRPWDGDIQRVVGFQQP